MRRIIVLTLFASLLFAVSAVAQNTDIEALAGISFNFGNPGARSLGMGGAFLGLADDASAAEANPAGLTILRKPEVSFEGRNWEVGQDTVVSGTFPTLERETFSQFSRRSEPAFGSIVIPMKSMALALYYHQQVRYSNSATVLPLYDGSGNLVRQVPNFYLPRNGTPVTRQQCISLANQHPEDPYACLEYRIFPFLTAVDVDLKTYGVAGAWKFGNLSLGLAGRYQKFNEGAFTYREDFEGNPNSIAVQATGELKDGNLVLKDQNKITFSGGFKWAMRENFSVGGVYKKGAEFTAPTFVQNAGSDIQKIADTKFHIPDIAGVGFSWRPLPVLTINVDGVHVYYSNLVDDFVSINTDVRSLHNAYTAKDVTEIHAGAEYFFTTKIPFAIRAGYWRDPAHQVQYTGPLNSPSRVASAILFPGSKDETHYSIGGGLAWPKFQIDAAYETSDFNKVGSLSAVFRF